MGERRKTLPFLSVVSAASPLEGGKSVVCCLRQHHLFLHGCGKVLPRGRATASPNISGMLFYEKRRFFVEGMRKQPAPEGDECPLFPCRREHAVREQSIPALTPSDGWAVCA